MRITLITHCLYPNTKCTSRVMNKIFQYNYLDDYRKQSAMIGQELRFIPLESQSGDYNTEGWQFSKWQPDLLMFRSRKSINNFIFSNNHQCNYTNTISRLRRREYRLWRLIVKQFMSGVDFYLLSSRSIHHNFLE